MSDKKHTVRVHIDRQVYESPSPTTGAALYALADIAKHRELFKEASGNHEDELIPRDDAEVRLKEDDHFYSQKAFDIIVNGEQKGTTDPRLSFEEVVKLAFGAPDAGPNILFTVAYRKGPPANPKGTLQPGQSVRIKNGMIFDVTQTDRS